MNFIILNTYKSYKFIILASGAAVLLVILAVLPLFASDYTPIFLSDVLLYLVLTVSWVMFSGWTGYFSLSTAAFVGTGMYISAMFGNLFPFIIVIIIAGLACVLLAFIIGVLTLKLHSTYFTIFTFAFIILVTVTVVYIQELFFRSGKSISVTYVHSQSSLEVYYYMMGIFVLLMLAIFIIKRTRYYLALLSIGQDEEAAAHTGVNVTILKITVFGISSFFMGAAGAVMAAKWTVITPPIAFNPFFSFMPVLLALFGGTGIIYGPIVGAIVFTYLEEFLLTRLPGLFPLIFGLVLLVTVLYLPDGIAGLIQKLYVKKFRGSNKYS